VEHASISHRQTAVEENQYPEDKQGWMAPTFISPRSQFRVTWIVAREGSSEKQVGAECLEPGKQVWGERFPEQASIKEL
jgi:hypothetical protein